MKKHQGAALAFIKRYQRKNPGESPSLQEVADHLGFTSRTSAHKIIAALKKSGAVKTKKGEYRSVITVTGKCPLCGH